MDAGGPPRVLAVNHTSMVSGAESVLLRVLGAAAAAGWPVVVACPGGPLAERSSAAGFAHLALPELMLAGGPRPLALATLAARHARAAGRLRRAAAGADLVVANGVRVLPTVRLARPPAPVVWLAHDIVAGRRWKRVVSAATGGVDVVVGGSRAVLDSIPAPGPVRRLIPYGTVWPVAPATPAPRRAPVVGCAALLTSWKGQDVLLDAVARLGRPELAVELLGGSFPKDGPYVRELRRRAVRPDLAGRVRFVGHVDDPLAAMRSWTVAVVASVDPEAGPLSMLEAMSLGVPVVATAHGGPPELLGDAGLLVPPGDAAALAEAIGRLVDDAALHERCAWAGPRLVAGGLTLQAQVQGVLGAFQDVARRGRRRSAGAAGGDQSGHRAGQDREVLPE